MDSTERNYSAQPKGNNGEKREKSTVDRQWVALTAYQPVDIVTKTVEVPVIKTIEKIVPKTIIQEKIVHVPKNVTHIVEKIVEVPEVKYIDKVVEVPHIHYKNKYVPKIEVVEKIIERQKIIEKWHNKTVEVPQIKEVLRYKQIDDVEEIIKYIPKNSGNIDWESEYRKYLQKKEMGGYTVDDSTMYQQQINMYNDYNEKAYAQNAYDRSYDYAQGPTNADETMEHNISKDAYLKNTYYNVNKSAYEQTQTIPRSKMMSPNSPSIRRLPSEDTKPVGCCGGKC